MSSTELSSRKRKSCLQCIHAKSKCSTSEERPDECYRCIRLNKPCKFEVIAKRPGPSKQSRSRVKQLEQRVESLIDLIAAQKNGSTTSNSPSTQQTQNAGIAQVVTPESTVTSATPKDGQVTEAPRYFVQSGPFEAFDPISAGILDEKHASKLVEEFRTSFAPIFPFVIVETDAHELRKEQPFLFHAILTVTSYANPPMQHMLEHELKRQLGRIVEYSRKNLQTLQGLLVYAAWYHAFYKPINQQLATIVQLCVALVQDLGLSKRTKHKPTKWSVADCIITGRPKGSLAEKRAYLGTFYINVLFAQAWRKRTTLSYTHYTGQCTEAFVESLVPTDVLIKPIIQGVELLARVNRYFSFDDIENCEIKGEKLLDMSVTNFLTELDRIRKTTATSPLAQQDTSLSLLLCLVEISINEVSLHSTLWSDSQESNAMLPTTVRLKMLRRFLKAGISYIKTLLHSSKELLYQLGISTWAGWFYALVLVCKLVFLTENELLGRSDLEDIPEELDNMIPQNIDQVLVESSNSDNLSAQASWNALSVNQEFGIQQLFEQFSEKLQFTLPAGVGPWGLPPDETDSLHSIGSIQRTLLNGFMKRLDQLASGGVRKNDSLPSERQAQAIAPSIIPQQDGPMPWQTPHLHPNGVYAPGPGVLPFASFMNFDSINFDGISVPTSMSYTPQAGQEMLGDWMWDMVMDDFTMPTL